MTTNNTQTIVKFLSILILATAVRIAYLSKSPPALYVDEAVIGYNAYSLGQTGKDEYGKPWPILLRSYGAFSASLYTILTVPVVKVFGLTEYSVRIVSVLSGVCLVLLIFWHWGPTAGWLAALTPVFIYFSRGAFEANLALTLLVAGLIMGFNYLKDTTQSGKLYLATLFFALSTYAYLAERVTAPILYLTLGLFALRNLLRNRRSIYPLIFSLLLFLIICLPIVQVSFTSGAGQRFSSLLPETNHSNSIGQSIHRYFAYFSIQNLFSRPDPDTQRSFPELSVYYWWWLFPFMVGLALCLRRFRNWGAEERILVILLFLAPLAGAVTKDYFSTLRVLPMYLPILVIIANGFILPRRFRGVVIGCITVVCLVSLYYNLTLHRYERAKEWLYPYRGLAIITANLVDKTIVIDNVRLKPFYIYYAYVNRLDPTIVQKWHQLDLSQYYSSFSFNNDMAFMHLQMRSIDFKTDIYADQYLVSDSLAISSQQAQEHFLKKIDTVSNLDGSEAYTIYQTDPLQKCLSDQKKSKLINQNCDKYIK